MTLAALIVALDVSRVKLEDARIVIFGSGSAGTGIAEQIAESIATETGKSKPEASKQIWYSLPRHLVRRDILSRTLLTSSTE